MKNYEFTYCFYDKEREGLKTRGAGENNPIELGVEYNNMALTTNNAVETMNIAMLSNEQVAQIKAQGDRRPTESAIARVKARAMATQNEEEQQYK